MVCIDTYDSILLLIGIFALAFINIWYGVMLDRVKKYLKMTDQLRAYRIWKVNRKEKIEEWN